MRRAPLTHAFTFIVTLSGLLTVSAPAAHADATIGLPSIDLDFASAPGISGEHQWCATGRASSEAVAPVWTVTFAGMRADGTVYRSGPHVFALPSMNVCGTMAKNFALAGTMSVTASYSGAVGSTPLAASGVSFWTGDGDYFKDWHN